MDMRRLSILLLAALTALASCTDGPITPEVIPVKDGSVTYNLTARHPDATKAVKSGWESGDAIFVFFSGAAAPKHLKMVFDGSSWNCDEYDGDTQSSGALGLKDGDSGTMRAVFLPFGSGLTVSNSGTDFTFSETQNTYYMTATLAYTVSENTVSGAFNMQIPAGYVQFFLDNDAAAESDVIELREPHLTPQGIASVAADGTIGHTSVAHGAPLKGYVYDKAEKASGEHKGYLFSGILADGARGKSTDYYFTIVRGGWAGSYYSKPFNGKTLSSHAAVKLPALAGWNAIADYKAIDLGFDYNGKRIYLCSRNIGATSDFPADGSEAARNATLGGLFAWAGTEPRTWFSEETAPYHHNSEFIYSKYIDDNDFVIRVDYKEQLDLEDDAARVNAGGLWRMPTLDEFHAIIDNLVWTWNSTLKGQVVTSLDPKYSSSVFFPTTNDYGDDWFGCYWSSTRNDYEQHSARYLEVSNPIPSSPGGATIGSYPRYEGMFIRGISE